MTQVTGAWVVGQLVELRVVEQVDARTVKLETAGKTLLAHTDLALSPGAVLRATVTAGGALPQLSVQEADAGLTPQASIAAGLGHALPKQIPLGETFPAMLSLVAAPETGPALPPEVRAGLEDLLSGLPETANLGRPAVLARALMDAGNSLESRLAQVVQASSVAVPKGDVVPGTDRKWQLLALREVVSTALVRLAPNSNAPAAPEVPPAFAKPGLPGSDEVARSAARSSVPGPADSSFAINAQTDAPPRPTERSALEGLLRDIDASLARLGTNQLQTAAAALQHQVFGFFELPLRPDLGHDPALLEFEADGSGAASRQDAPFVAKLELPLGELGVFRARIALHGERVAVSAWSESPALRERIAERLSELDKALGDSGLSVVPSTVRKMDSPSALRPGTLPLVDTRA